MAKSKAEPKSPKILKAPPNTPKTPSSSMAMMFQKLNRSSSDDSELSDYSLLDPEDFDSKEEEHSASPDINQMDEDGSTSASETPRPAPRADVPKINLALIKNYDPTLFIPYDPSKAKIKAHKPEDPVRIQAQEDAHWQRMYDLKSTVVQIEQDIELCNAKINYYKQRQKRHPQDPTNAEKLSYYREQREIKYDEREVLRPGICWAHDLPMLEAHVFVKEFFELDLNQISHLIQHGFPANDKKCANQYLKKMGLNSYNDEKKANATLAGLYLILGETGMAQEFFEELFAIEGNYPYEDACKAIFSMISDPSEQQNSALNMNS